MSDAETSSDMALGATRELRSAVRRSLVQAALPIALLMLLLGFAIVDVRVLSPANLMNIAQQTGYLALFAMAQTVVILTRGFDLSLGPTVSAVSVGAALAMASGTSAHQGPSVILLLGLGAGFVLGAACGLFNGSVVALLGVNPFVATLGSYNIAIGIATTISGGRPVQGVPDVFTQLFYGGTLFGVPAVVIIALILGVILHIVLTRSVFGRSLYLIGTNPRAAMVAGLPVKRILVTTYLLCSGIAALGALMLTARTGSGEPNLGGSLSLQATAAAVIGGTSLAGGKGGVGTAVLGALFVTILSNGMNLVRIDGYVQMVVLGAIVIAGVVLDRARLEQR
ncbi:ABC transporter permease [Lichenifustis flavocetrariae]|uniref:ABC transporter permease n=1 Tax=Lichenifustis flavocetrariae TaxID=2949735 RepID=A0AA41YW54_9HYPH|nr:ABC transporter permease [Lichenifustis flavocetrariae]MCW6509681.1 ABC transporter permease [Lichenifustis flavocetrariae]